CRLAVSVQPQVGEPERLADRGLVGLSPLCLLERHGRLGIVASLEVRPSPLEQLVCLLAVHVLTLAVPTRARKRQSSRVVCASIDRSRSAPVSRSRRSIAWRSSCRTRRSAGRISRPAAAATAGGA